MFGWYITGIEERCSDSRYAVIVVFAWPRFLNKVMVWCPRVCFTLWKLGGSFLGFKITKKCLAERELGEMH